MSIRLKILVIDDEENMRHMFSVMLHKYGYSAECAENGVSALQLLSKRTYDFIICDIRMPGMDGLSFLRQAVASGVTSPIIMMSAYGAKEIADRCMQEGAVDFICKPFNHHELINRLLNRYGAE
jgi:two-component system response regulator AtoC